MHDLCEELRELVARCADELFADYGCGAVAIDTLDEPPSQLCGILGFTGDTLCGSVIIVATPEALTASNPTPDVSLTRWLSELTNQIVGRFKNELLRRGVDVTMSVPVALRATRMEPVLQKPSAPVLRRIGEGSLSMWLELEGEAVLHEPDDSSIPREGEALLF